MPSFFASCGTMIAVFPLAVWAHDSFFSICRVRGSSMEPTLFCGDILVVRKSDGFWQRWTRPRTIEGEEVMEDERPKDNIEWAIERERVLAYEREYCNSNGSIGLLRKPPTPITGNIVVFKNPERFPDQWNIKRVVALGGQIVLTEANAKTSQQKKESNRVVMSLSDDTECYNNKEGKKAGTRTSTAYVPPYCIWVEGDNRTNSRDSRSKDHGPVSKKLLVGIAEYRVWPPWRMGKLDNKNKPNKCIIER